MKSVIVYHKNLSRYPKEWIDRFRDSILNQTDKNFDIFELNYGGGDERIFTGEFLSFELNNHAEAQNKLIDLAFELNYDFVFNTNVDDYYSLDRIEKQTPFLEAGYDIVSSNFSLVSDEIYHTHEFDKLNIRTELSKDHNIICHPVVGYSKHFWRNNRYRPHEIPFEDMKLWQRAIPSFRFIILPEILCYHRVHQNSVGVKG